MKIQTSHFKKDVQNGNFFETQKVIIQKTN